MHHDEYGQVKDYNGCIHNLLSLFLFLELNSIVHLIQLGGGQYRTQVDTSK